MMKHLLVKIFIHHIIKFYYLFGCMLVNPSNLRDNQIKVVIEPPPNLSRQKDEIRKTILQVFPLNFILNRLN